MRSTTEPTALGYYEILLVLASLYRSGLGDAGNELSCLLCLEIIGRQTNFHYLLWDSIERVRASVLMACD